MTPTPAHIQSGPAELQLTDWLILQTLRLMPESSDVARDWLDEIAKRTWPTAWSCSPNGLTALGHRHRMRKRTRLALALLERHGYVRTLQHCYRVTNAGHKYAAQSAAFWADQPRMWTVGG
jgi:hypothetical protein